MPPGAGTSYLYQNNGDGSFTRANSRWGINQKTVSNGAAYVDLDNDGAMDLVINNTNDFASVYRNNARRMTNGHYLKIALQGDPRNVNGIGAKGRSSFAKTPYTTRRPSPSAAFSLRWTRSSILGRVTTPRSTHFS